MDTPVLRGESSSFVDTSVLRGESSSFMDAPVLRGESSSFVDTPVLHGESSSFVDTPVIRGESSSSQFSHSPKWNYDVFISFRGEDTRKNFTGHLYNRLCHSGINTFIDDEELRKGEVISKGLEEAIEGSGYSIVVLSENYASSTWCLDELVKILECKEKLKQEVLPVFYKVDPSDVRKQTGSFGKALAKHKEQKWKAALVKIIEWKDKLKQVVLRVFYKVDPSQVTNQTGSFGEALAKHRERFEKWTAALTEVANLSGMSLQDDSDGYEYNFIKNIVEQVSQKVNQIPLEIALHPVGVDSRVKDLELLLQSGNEDEVRMVGIYGVGGIGKTTLAKAIYNRTFRDFDSSCFLSNVRSEAEQYNGVVKLQEKLLHQILRHELKVRNVDEGVSLIKARLGSKKVLIVLDDVDHIRQLDSLAIEKEWFGSGSLIIITTRDEHLLCRHRENEKYKAKVLDDDEAQELFSRHAFEILSPPQEYLELVQGFINYSGGIPLALVTLGSHLQGLSVAEWGFEFKKLREIPHPDVQKILQISFNGLDFDTRCVFLDIACAFDQTPEEEVITILNACGFHSESAIATLVRKCLLQRKGYGSVNITQYLEMHDLVRDMGREIIRIESREYPGKRSRLFNPQEVRDVLQENKGSEKIQVLMVDSKEFKDVNLSIKAFEKMKNLRVLKIDNLAIRGNFELLSKELRWLSWQMCPLECIPSSFPVGKLVVLDMSGSHIQEFGVNLQCFKSLKKLILTDCYLLKRTPNFTGAASLERLLLNGCSKLKEIHQSIGNLDKLLELDLNLCYKLRDLPSGLCHLNSLQLLDISWCEKIQTLPIDLRSLKTLIAENMSGIERWPTPVEMTRDADDIPWNIGNLSSLERLDLRCNKFHCLPLDLSKLLRLEILSLYNCWNLQTLSVVDLKYLREIQLMECKKLVKTVLNNLPSISRIYMDGCTSLQNPFNEALFFSAHALALESKEDRNLVMKPELHIVFECNEIPDWCRNIVRASSICFTMPTHNNEYKFLGMVLWFVCKDWVLEPGGFTFSIVEKVQAGTIWPRHFQSINSSTDASYSYVFYRSYLETPFDGQIEGGEKIQVVETCVDNINVVKQIGIHLLYLDQHGQVISLPAVVEQECVNLQAPNLGRRGIKKFITNYDYDLY